MANERPASASGGDLDSASNAVPPPISIPSPITRRQQKLQVVVEQLTERNAALEREVGEMVSATASASVLLPPNFAEPPPVYVESPDSSVPPRLKLP